MSCPHGGYPSIRHNEVRDLTASLLREVCNDVVVEPQLQPLEGEILHGRTCNRRDDARLGVSMQGFWGERFGRAFVDIRVFAHSLSLIALPCWASTKSMKVRSDVHMNKELRWSSSALSCHLFLRPLVAWVKLPLSSFAALAL